MKKLIPMLLLLFIGCSNEYDIAELKAPVKELIGLLKASNTSAMSTCYDSDFFKYQDYNEWSVFLNNIVEDHGKIQTYRMTEHYIHYGDLYEPDTFHFTYEIIHSNAVVEHTFILLMENSKYKIGFHEIDIQLN